MDLSNLDWDKVDGDYLAYQARGAPYGLVRNVFRPSLLFPIVTGTLRVFPGWYTDRNGRIEKVATEEGGDTKPRPGRGGRCSPAGARLPAPQ